MEQPNFCAKFCCTSPEVKQFVPQGRWARTVRSRIPTYSTDAVVYLSCPLGHERHFSLKSAILLTDGFTPRYQRKRFRRNCDQSQPRPSRYPNTRLESLKHFQSSHPPSPTGHKAEEQSTDSSKRPYLEPTLGRRGGFRRLSPLP